MIEISSIQLLVIPAITGIVQAVKNAGVNTKYAPFIAIALGVGIMLGVDLSFQSGLMGALSGLSAIGLYEFPKQASSKK